MTARVRTTDRAVISLCDLVRRMRPVPRVEVFWWSDGNDADFWKLGKRVVEAVAVRGRRGAHHECVRHDLPAPGTDAPERPPALSRGIADAGMAVADDRNGDQGVGCVSSEASCLRRPGRGSAQPGAGRAAEYRSQGRFLLPERSSPSRGPGEVWKGDTKRLD